jgi:hypothetical protein
MKVLALALIFAVVALASPSAPRAGEMWEDAGDCLSSLSQKRRIEHRKHFMEQCVKGLDSTYLAWCEGEADKLVVDTDVNVAECPHYHHDLENQRNNHLHLGSIKLLS